MKWVSHLPQIGKLPIIYLGDIYNIGHNPISVESKIATHGVDQPESIQISFGDNPLTILGYSSRAVKAEGLEIVQEGHTKPSLQVDCPTIHL